MVANMAVTPSLQWSKPSAAHTPSYSKPTAGDVVFYRNRFLGSNSCKLSRSQSAEFKPKQSNSHSNIRRVCSASFDDFSGDELNFRLHFPHAGDCSGDADSPIESRWPEIQLEPLDWAGRIEMKANSVDLPVSLRMIKRKMKQWHERFLDSSESAYCSVNKAFSSMVFIIRELHSFTIQMREILFYEDLQGILERVKREIHASFVWLFQQVFSHTPTLMVSLMILLANFTVHSMSASPAIAAVEPPSAVLEERDFSTSINFDHSITKSFSISSSETTVGGGRGDGSNTKPTTSGTEGDGGINRSEILHRQILPNGVSPVMTTDEKEEEEAALWNSMVEEASRMEGEAMDEELLNRETLQRFVSPVTVKIEADAGAGYEEHFRTEIRYQAALEQDPNNVLLLTNYAQFLFLVARDYERAEEFFKRAIKVEPKDADAHSKYGNFLWRVKNDLWAAEESFLEAISADPSNSFYAANYAHFLWNTGGEDTCFPLNDDSVHLDDA